jgi:crescentin
MKLLPRSIGAQRDRNAKPVAKTAPVQATATREELADEVSHEIGARYEKVSQRIDDATDLLTRLEPMADLISQIRDAVSVEFRERRLEHGELLGLRSTIDQYRSRLEVLETDHREALANLGRTETELFEVGAQAEADRRKLENALEEEQNLRSELSAATVRISQLDESLKSALDSVSQLTEDRDALRDQLGQSEERRRESDSAAASSRQQTLMAQEEQAVMRKQLETASVDATRMSRQLTELESLLGSERARVRGLEASLASVQEESLRSVRAVEARLEATRIELTVATGKAESYLAQTAKLEGLNAEVSQRLNETQAQLRGVERQFSELQVDHNRADERNRALEEELATLRVRLATVESARAAAVERSDQLSKQVHAQEVALKRAEGRATDLRERLENAQSENAARRSSLEERLSNLEAGLERERAERTIAEGALESLRKERGRSGASDDRGE